LFFVFKIKKKIVEQTNLISCPVQCDALAKRRA